MISAELAIELKNLIRLANENGAHRASEWLVAQLASQAELFEEHPAGAPIIKHFQKGDPCDVCKDGSLIGGEGVATSICGYSCNGYCAMCGQRYLWGE
jgi:hypothetical protein